MDDTLLSLSFRRSPLEHTIYVRRNGNAQLVVGVYVDDLGLSFGAIGAFKKKN